MPKATASEPAYVLASYMQANAQSTTWGIPSGMKRSWRRTASVNLRRDLDAGATFEVGPISASNDTCGFVHVSLLRRL
jgi:hypothetical protein